tara:strand:- start:176 stop:352 length:177 start_codon:yes stop_codon:yes gene_type:complete
MPFDPKSAKIAGKQSRRGPAKKDELSIKEKMELLYQKVLDDIDIKSIVSFSNITSIKA